MLLIAFRDLQFRLRRFLISVVAVALVLTLTLLLSGVAASFDREVEDTLARFDADAWIVSANATGPFLGAIAMPESQVDEVAALDGVDEAGPMGFVSTTLADSGGARPIVLIGVEPGGVGAPAVRNGAALSASGQAVVDKELGLAVGEKLELGGESLEVVGTLDGATLLAGQPEAFVAMDDLQTISFSGAPVVSSVAIRGTPNDVPDGLALMTQSDAHADLLRPIAPAKDTITLLSVLLWIVTGCIIGSVIYLSALERIRDFAVLKAIGVATSWVLIGLILQAAFLSLLASLVAVVLAVLLSPVISMPVVLSPGILLFVPATAVIVSILGSLVGVRRAVSVDPALAFG